MSPDPSHNSEDRRPPNEGNYVIGAVNNIQNENEISYEGYEMLPQDINDSNVETEAVDVQDSNSEDENVVAEPVPPCAFDQAVKIELTELWNSSFDNRITDIAMDSTKEEVIKNAMANFILPPTSIPSWAKNIPEEEWKEQILSRINSSNRT